eukprot:177355-Pleurochrysis_carterae.AAC.2
MVAQTIISSVEGQQHLQPSMALAAAMLRSHITLKQGEQVILSNVVTCLMEQVNLLLTVGLPSEDWGLQPVRFIAEALSLLSPRAWVRREEQLAHACARWAAVEDAGDVDVDPCVHTTEKAAAAGRRPPSGGSKARVHVVSEDGSTACLSTLRDSLQSSALHAAATELVAARETVIRARGVAWLRAPLLPALCRCARVQRLELGRINASQMQQLPALLGSLPSLTSLSLAPRQHLSARCAAALAAALRAAPPTLSQLQLPQMRAGLGARARGGQGGRTGDDGEREEALANAVRVLAPWLPRADGLLQLSLCGSALGDCGMLMLCAGLRAHAAAQGRACGNGGGLELLDVSGCLFGDSGMAALARLLPRVGALRVLAVSGSRASSTAAHVVLALALKRCARLRELHWAGAHSGTAALTLPCQIGDGGAGSTTAGTGTLGGGAEGENGGGAASVSCSCGGFRRRSASQWLLALASSLESLPELTLLDISFQSLGRGRSQIARTNPSEGGALLRAERREESGNEHGDSPGDGDGDGRGGRVARAVWAEQRRLVAACASLSRALSSTGAFKSLHAGHNRLGDEAAAALVHRLGGLAEARTLTHARALTHDHTRSRTLTRTRTNAPLTYAHARTRARSRALTRTLTRAHTHAQARSRARTRTLTHAHAHARARSRTRAHACSRTLTRAHLRSRALTHATLTSARARSRTRSRALKRAHARLRALTHAHAR